MSRSRRRLAARRSLVGHTQESLAQALGLGSTTTVARWEQGGSTPRARNRPALARELNVTLDELDALLETPPYGRDDHSGLGARTSVRPGHEPSHVVAALDDTRYMDDEVIAYFRSEIAACAVDDGDAGPRQALPRALGVVGAVGRHARDASASVRRDLLIVGARAAELLGWLYRDIGAPTLSDHWRDRAFEWAAEAGDLPMCGFVLLRKSQAAWDQRDAVKMLSLAQAAQRPAWGVPARVHAEAAQQEARGWAMLGGRADVIDAKLDQAYEGLESAPVSDAVDPLTPGSRYDHALLSLQVAICHTESGRPRKAMDLYASCLTDDRFSRRDYGYFLALLAGTLASADEVDEAATTGLRAHALAADTDSTRTVAEVRRLARSLAAWRTIPAVRDLQDAALVP